MFYELHLPFPPTVNSYYKKSRYGVHIAEAGRKYRSQVLAEVEEQWGSTSRLDYKLYVEVVIHPPDKRKRDLDNYMKALLDSLTEAGIWEDDSLIDQLIVYRGERTFSGKVSMRIHEAGPVLKLGQFIPD